jgi:hypothetical protein
VLVPAFRTKLPSSEVLVSPKGFVRRSEFTHLLGLQESTIVDNGANKRGKGQEQYRAHQPLLLAPDGCAN